MKTIGLIGGMSCESTADYYREINTGIKNKLGGLNSAKISLYSVNFAEIEKLQHSGNWEDTSKILEDAARKVEAAGADFFLICTNTMHKVAEKIENAVNIPLLHIADATAEALLADNIKKVGLFGTAFTMEQDFYKGRLREKFGLDVIVPGKNDRKIIHDVIYKELCLGTTLESSKNEFVRISEQLLIDGCEALILGCTEIGILLKQKDTKIKLYDTTKVHALSAVNFALR